MLQASLTTRSAEIQPSTALGSLLTELIDYAGLFPPAKLSMPDAVNNYAKYLHDNFRWMLGRFIVPVAGLAEFETAVSAAEISQKASVSALLGSDIAADIATISQFNTRHAGKIQISSVELKISTPEDIRNADKLIPRDLEAFFELPLSGDVAVCIDTLSQCGRNAKIRTGGETPEMIPSSDSLANFLNLCAESSLPFKATAGLHHPIRSTRRLTCAGNSPSGIMHGFLNVFLAAAFLRQRVINLAEANELLSEMSAAAFVFGESHVTWRLHVLTTEQIASARQQFALSFGSCSFSEPVEDLQALSLL
jgi:hypothetical protein